MLQYFPQENIFICRFINKQLINQIKQILIMATSITSSPTKSLPSTNYQLSKSNSSNSDQGSIGDFPLSLFPSLNPKTQSDTFKNKVSQQPILTSNILKTLISISKDLQYFQMKWTDIEKYYKAQSSLADQFYADIVLYIENLRQHHNSILKKQKQSTLKFIQTHLSQVSFQLEKLNKQISQISKIPSSNPHPPLSQQISPPLLQKLQSQLKVYKLHDSKISKLSKQSLDDQFLIFLKVVNKMFGVKFEEGYEMFPKEEDKLNISLGSSIQWLEKSNASMIEGISIIDKLWTEDKFNIGKSI